MNTQEQIPRVLQLLTFWEAHGVVLGHLLGSYVTHVLYMYTARISSQSWL